jgi:uncharacterized protein YdhG (YjbR/CyaY superfamily)
LQSANTKFQTMDEYIAAFPNDVQDRLQNIRQSIKKAAPDAKETIKYNMPTFTLNGNLIHFAAFKKHITLFGTPSPALEAFKQELPSYVTAKGAIKLPLDQPLPTDLLKTIVELTVKDNLKKAKNNK